MDLKGKPQNMVGAFLGTGFGGGVILNGELFRGHNYAAGEFGQMTIDKNGLKTARIVSAVASNRWLVARA